MDWLIMQILIDFCDPQGINTSALRCAFDAPLQTLVAHTPEQVKPLLHQVQTHARQGRWCVGFLRYEAASAFDKALLTHATDGPLAWFAVFETAQPWPQAVASVMPPDTSPAPAWLSSLSRDSFEHQMTRIHAAIAAGELYQINYTAMLSSRLSDTPLGLFARLQMAQPQAYAAYIDTGDEQVLSVSPELFFDWDGQHLLTRPMKGTAARGHNPAQDAALAHGLTESPKERAENVMIVDLLRNDLSRIAVPHSVKVPALFKVQSLATVHQMVSDVTAQTRPDCTLADVFAALFPCGSITGAPKVRAMQMIAALEPQARGVYCGAIGVVRPGGHATFNVAIRSVTARGQQLQCGIGSGITADASAAAEWLEWQHNRAFLLRAAAPFDLLETLRLQGGTYQRLDLHLQRLAGAAKHFGYPYDEARIRNALQAAARHDAQACRARLLLDAQGCPRLEIYELNEVQAPILIELAATCFEASDAEFSRYKTTRREHYEAFAPTNPAVFDTLLWNTRGELTECTRGNIALLLDGRWYTPAVHCGLLPGVARRDALAQGQLSEAVLTRADLQRAQGLAFINSLRGWLPARRQ
jgi:para-aminobenzoate synthetase/4-amino-4-deoxychorismate lyase